MYDGKGNAYSAENWRSGPIPNAVNPIAHIFCHVKQMQSSFVALSTILPKLHVLNLGTYLPAEGGSD